MKPLRLTFRALGAADTDAPGVEFRPAGLFLLPAEIGGMPLLDALRAAIGGQVVPEGGAELALEFEISGERFRAWRCWEGGVRPGRDKTDASARPALALLGRPTGVEITEMEVIAEGPDRVSAELQRLIGHGSANAGVVIAPWSRIVRLVASSPHAGAGVAPGVFALLSAEIEPVSRTMGGRIRELLLAAHDLLRAATERLAPDQSDTLTPDDLVARRDELTALLARHSRSSGRLVDAAVAARKLAAEVRRRKDVADGYFKSEEILRKLELRKGAVESSRRRLERARRAARLADKLGLKARASAPPRVDPRVREQAEAALERARADAGAARRALDVQDARARERDALEDWIGRLEALQPALARLEEARTAIRHGEEAHAAAETAHSRGRRELDSVTQRLAALEAEAQVLREGPSHLEQMRQELRTAQRLRDDAKRLASVRERLRVEARDLQVAKLLVDQADETLEAARRELDYRARSPIATDGHEPVPSIPDLVARREELARDAARQAEVLAAVREDLRDLTGSLGASAYQEPALLEAAAREKENALAHWGSSARSLAEIEAEIADLGARGVDLARQVEERGAEVDAALFRHQQARNSLREREAAVPENLRSREELGSALDMARADLAARDAALKDARSAVRRAEEILAACEAGLRAAQDAERGQKAPDRRGEQLIRLQDGGFETWEEFEQARLPERDAAELEREVSEHDEALRAAEERVRLGQDQAIRPRQDPDQVDLMAAIVEHARDQAQADEAAVSQEAALIEGWIDGLDDISTSLSALEESAGLGRRGDTRPGGTFELRVHEALMRALLARAEGRLARWQRPWTLAWRDGEDEASRHLEIRDAETDRPVDLSGPGAVLPCLALALETAVLLQERRRPRLETIVIDALPADLSGEALERAVAALDEVARDHPVGIPADAGATERLAPRIPA